MIIELRGVEFVNKGAELMLQAILEEVKKRIPKAKFAMEASNRVPLNKLKENGILRKANFSKYGFDLSSIFNLLPDSFLIKKGYAKTNSIGAVLDGSGFAYGDKWGVKKADDRAGKFISAWKSKGQKVILLPQAFGPFSGEGLREKMQMILSEADLVFARDKQSFQYLSELGEFQNLQLAPDFTNLISGVKPSQNFDNRIAIIPNQKMTETDNESVNGSYLDYLQATIQALQKKGEDPFFLIHESQKDQGIADQINQKLSKPIEVILEEDPLRVKGIIGSCKAVITSRFHGLVSALCQAVPCLSTGWSHKYKELLDDYQNSEALCQVSLDESYLNEKLNLILDEPKRQFTISNLEKNSAFQKERSNDMWDLVISALTTS